jgi:hypothetical protein
VQKPKEGEQNAMATVEEGSWRFWPALEPNSSSSNQLSTVAKGINKLCGRRVFSAHRARVGCYVYACMLLELGCGCGCGWGNGFGPASRER